MGHIIGNKNSIILTNHITIMQINIMNNKEDNLIIDNNTHKLILTKHSKIL